ncbi:hypothetical protein SAMN05444483_103192 [Salegentibacter echinorum]|uniref:4-amino-4-deoxy-L-arabinose transferase n=1 Tax=Salegentibacter echinorum TaxID=1073325 RepID=A0A1M5FH17_SALEC|nr:hypothetical protein [Salegentibacter echinorum]SHF90857.1 hypothetical protein SAMN05444483_103192 [Salegentibacter echinorum]
MIKNNISAKDKHSQLELWAYVIFGISNFLMLFNPGVFWDDWTIYNMDPVGLMNQYYGNGNLMFGYIHLFLKHLSGSPLLYHALTFICQLLNIFILFRIVKEVSLKANEKSYFAFAVLIFAAFPIHDAKATIIIFPHILCLTSFIAGSYFLLSYTNKKKLLHRVLGLFFFLFSFLINSFLVFYLFPVFFFLFHEYWILFFGKNYGKLQDLVKSLGHRILSYIDFLVLPFVFWIIKLSFFQPSMQYKSIGYNTVKLESLLEIPYRVIVFLYLFVVDLVPIVIEAIQHYEMWIFFILANAILYRQLQKLKLGFTVPWKFIIWGLLVLIIGAFPYLMVNKYPSYLDYLSRHQLLLGLGASLSFCAAVFLLKSELIKRIILTISVSAFMAITIFLHFNYFKGYVKQEVFKQYFFSNPHFPAASPQTIVLEDDTENFTRKGNPTKFYAFAGMMKMYYPNENTLLVRPEDLKGYQNLNIFPKLAPYYFQYNLTNYKYVAPKISLEVKYGEKRPLFPIWTYYSDLALGNQKDWSKYFKFTLQPLGN